MVVEKLRVVMRDDEHGVCLVTELNELRNTAGVIAWIAASAAEETESDDEELLMMIFEFQIKVSRLGSLARDYIFFAEKFSKSLKITGHLQEKNYTNKNLFLNFHHSILQDGYRKEGSLTEGEAR